MFRGISDPDLDVRSRSIKKKACETKSKAKVVGGDRGWRKLPL